MTHLTQVNLGNTMVQLQWLPLVLYPVITLVCSEVGHCVLHSRGLAHWCIAAKIHCCCAR